MAKIALGQSKMASRPIVGALHVIVYVGFIIINIELLEIVIDGLVGTHRIFSGMGIININNEKYRKDFSPVDENSPHAFGRIFSKAYLRHLFNINEILGLRIASTLNLAYYLNLMTIMRQKIQAGDFSVWSKSWFRDMEDKKGM